MGFNLGHKQIMCRKRRTREGGGRENKKSRKGKKTKRNGKNRREMHELKRGKIFFTNSEERPRIVLCFR